MSYALYGIIIIALSYIAAYSLKAS